MGAPALIHELMISGLIRPCCELMSPCERAQIRFSTFDCAMPDPTDLQTIYGSICEGHFMGFDEKVLESTKAITVEPVDN
jgi:hypothetical protein